MHPSARTPHPLAPDAGGGNLQLTCPGDMQCSSPALKHLGATGDALAELMPLTHQTRQFCLMVAFGFEHEPSWRPNCLLP